MRKIPLILLCLFVTLSLFAQWNSFVVNYKKDLFGRGAQTWKIRSYDKNHLFCGNKNGMLQYNGNEWKLYAIDNKSDVRSVYVSERNRRVYVGADNEFGYFEPGATGELLYTKLSDPYNDRFQLYGGYWGIFEVDNIFYFVSDRHVAKYLNNEFTAIVSDIKIECSAVIKGTLYVGTEDGIRMLVGNTWLPVPDGNVLSNKTIRAISPYREGYLAATPFDGLYYGNEKEILPFDSGDDAFLRQNEIFSMAVSGERIAIGTIHKGVMLLDRERALLQYYNEQNGVQNNTVLSICFDHYDNLWLGLDNGIDYISLQSPLSNLYTYPYSKGAGYDALIDDNRIYLGTNRGLYYSDWPVAFDENPIDMPLIAPLSGQVWGLERIGDDLFCLHDKGLFLIQKEKIELIPGLRGAIRCVPYGEDSSRCWVGTYDGLFLIEKRQGRWKVSHRVNGISYWMRNALFLSPHELWLQNSGNQIIQLELDDSGRNLVNTTLHDRSSEGTELTNTAIFLVDGRIVVSSDSGFYQYDTVSRRLIRDPLLNTMLDADRQYLRIKSSAHTLFALSPDQIQAVRFDAGRAYSRFSFPINASQIDFIRSYESLVVLDDSRVIIPNEYGFAMVHTAGDYLPVDQDLYLRHVYITYPKDSVLYCENFLHKMEEPVIAYTNNSLRFEYGVRSFQAAPEVKYRYRLLPDKVWSEASLSTVKEYSNLSEGNYRFEVSAVMSDGTEEMRFYPFTVMPPWYRTGYAWTGYLLLFVFLIYLFYLWDERRLARKNQAELAEKERELQQKEYEFQKENQRKEQEIIQLQTDKLEQELRHKGQEMANLMINLSRKNEILFSIKEELHKTMKEMKGEQFVKSKRMLLTLAGTIDTNIESDDALKRFEEQFDLVHNNFIRRILEAHPDLTVSERKMCAYVKMNLASKEIAPLLNISVRGVETLRYRLRKKMQLEREDSLTEYLNSFS